jgi:hypothetical protein
MSRDYTNAAIGCGVQTFVPCSKAPPCRRRAALCPMQPQAPHGACGLRPVPARRAAAVCVAA